MPRPAKLMLAAALLAAPIGASAQSADPAAADRETAKARALSNGTFDSTLCMCGAGNNATISHQIVAGAKRWFPPTRAFDNLFYIGNGFVGSWILATRDGLILFDTLESETEIRERLEPGLRSLGIDPATIRYAIVTQPHWDHYGGAKYLQDHYGTRIGLSAPDWALLERAPVGGMERAPHGGADRPIPKRDMVITDGQALRLGGETVRLYITPGHTPGTVSAIIPAREGGKLTPMSLLGGTALPPTLKPTDRAGGLIAFEASIHRLAQLSRDAGAVGVINAHIFVDGSDRRLDAAAVRKPGQTNPFILGADAVRRYYGVFAACIRATEDRPIIPNEWAAPLPPKAS